MNFSKGEIITFEDDNNKVIILETLFYNNTEYLYVQRLLSDESELVDDEFILKPNYEDGTMEKITDINLLYKITPKFIEMLKEYE